MSISWHGQRHWVPTWLVGVGDSISSSVHWVLIRAIPRSFWFVAWLLQSIKQYISHSSQEEMFDSSLEDFLFHSKLFRDAFVQVYYTIFVIFSSWHYTFLTNLHLWKHPPAFAHIQQSPRQKELWANSDGQVLRAVVQSLTWPDTMLSSPVCCSWYWEQRETPEGNVREWMSCVPLLWEAPATHLKGNCDISRVILHLNIYWTEYCWI